MMNDQILVSKQESQDTTKRCHTLWNLLPQLWGQLSVAETIQNTKSIR